MDLEPVFWPPSPLFAPKMHHGKIHIPVRELIHLQAKRPLIFPEAFHQAGRQKRGLDLDILAHIAAADGVKDQLGFAGIKIPVILVSVTCKDTV